MPPLRLSHGGGGEDLTSSSAPLDNWNVLGLRTACPPGDCAEVCHRGSTLPSVFCTVLPTHCMEGRGPGGPCALPCPASLPASTTDGTTLPLLPSLPDIRTDRWCLAASLGQADPTRARIQNDPRPRAQPQCHRHLHTHTHTQPGSAHTRDQMGTSPTSTSPAPPSRGRGLSCRTPCPFPSAALFAPCQLDCKLRVHTGHQLCRHLTLVFSCHYLTCSFLNLLTAFTSLPLNQASGGFSAWFTPEQDGAGSAGR